MRVRSERMRAWRGCVRGFVSQPVRQYAWPQMECDKAACTLSLCEPRNCACVLGAFCVLLHCEGAVLIASLPFSALCQPPWPHTQPGHEQYAAGLGPRAACWALRGPCGGGHTEMGHIACIAGWKIDEGAFREDLVITNAHQCGHLTRWGLTPGPPGASQGGGRILHDTSSVHSIFRGAGQPIPYMYTSSQQCSKCIRLYGSLYVTNASVVCRSWFNMHVLHSCTY